MNRDPTTSDPLRMYTAIGDLLTLAEAAARLRVSARSVRREIADGHIAAVQVRTRLRVSTAELARYIAARETRCQSENTANAGKLESLSEVASALSKHFRAAPPGPTRSRTKLRSGGRRSTLRLVETSDTP